MTSKVYFIKSNIEEGEQKISEKARKLFKAGGFAECFNENDFTAVKVHVGEHRNNTYVKAPCLKGIVEELLKLKTKPFLTDTSTLYASRRRNAIDHAIVAAEHGFSLQVLGVPFIAADGLFGTFQAPVKIKGEIDKEVYIAPDIIKCQSLLSIAHFTGHIATGVGATLKTLGMGCSSKRGKLKQHAALKLSITSKCTRCGTCIVHCPVDAISLNALQANIDPDKCISCAECVAVCRFGAVKCNWGPETDVMQKSIAEHAMGALKGKENRAAFFNFILSVTEDCDCVGSPNIRKIVDDIGIVASTNPVAVDVAALDLVENKTGRKLAELLGNDMLNPRCQFEHAERIGLGSSIYDLIEID